MKHNQEQDQEQENLFFIPKKRFYICNCNASQALIYFVIRKKEKEIKRFPYPDLKRDSISIDTFPTPFSYLFVNKPNVYSLSW